MTTKIEASSFGGRLAKSFHSAGRSADDNDVMFGDGEEAPLI